MSGEADYDLSGDWSGFFNYPIPRPPVSFEAILLEAEGRLTGSTTERGDLPHTMSRTLRAVIDGHREGMRVEFLKMYEDADGDYDAVRYTGHVEAGGDEISGEWQIPGVWSGTFLMIRGPRAKASVERSVTEKIEL